MDRRLTPANGRVAASFLEGQVESPRFVEGELLQVGRPLLSLWRGEDRASRERQLVLGEQVKVYERTVDMAFVQCRRDGFVGYVEQGGLADPIDATHAVCVPATHLYPVPDMKRPERVGLSFGSRLRVVSASGNFFETSEGGFVPKPHLRPINRPFVDPVTVAQLFFGVPYLWGGNSVWGIDCSGLVQAAFLAAGLPCPGDSDLQEAALGAPVPDNAATRRGDLYFWKGHVALAVDEHTLIHANAFHMAVAYERIDDAVARIRSQDDGEVTSRRRL